MRQFNFDTNIEERMPQTGKVYYISRMTSDWAEAHPFDLGAFIEQVYEKYQKIAAEDTRLAAWAKTREELRRQWVTTMSVTRVSGDATIYPNRDGRQEPALMEVWQKAGEYWARGLRLGDTLPKLVPPCRVTRLDDGGWIALFPKELNLLDVSGEEQEVSEDLEVREDDIEATEQGATETNATAPYHSGAMPVLEPVLEVSEEKPEPRPVIEPVRNQGNEEMATRQRQQRREERERVQRSYEERMEREAREAEMAARGEQRKKLLAAAGAAAVTLVMIHFFGLLGPAVFGMVCGGILKG